LFSRFCVWALWRTGAKNRAQKTRPSTQYTVNDLASPGY
jgi:hypothetical protein